MPIRQNWRRLCGALMVLAATTSLSAQAGVIEIIYLDDPGFGFNDNTIAQAAPGNPGQTLGQQRRAALEKSIDIWASRLDSNVATRLEVSFDDLGCGERTTLGQAGSKGIIRNFPNAPEFNINFPLALAAALRGEQISNFSAEMLAEFNFRIDEGDCSENIDGFWYGLDPDVPSAFGTASFLELALHEIGHALGFQSLVDRENFEFRFDRPDRMSRFIYSTSLEKSWRDMTAGERETSSSSGPNLVFTGERTNLRAAERLLPPSQVRLNPSGTSFPAFINGFQPFLGLEGLNAPLILADGPGPGPAAGNPWHRTLACEPLTNVDAAAGAVVMIRRGECTFASKWQNAFDAGAVGVIIVDDRPATAEGNIARDSAMALDRNLPIPLWSVSEGTGNQMRNLMPADSIDLRYQIDGPARGTNQGFVNLQASTENQSSNVSHFATSMFPRSVMNPSLTNTAFDGNLDFTPELMHDLGWPSNAARLAEYSGNWFNPGRSGEGCQLTMEQGSEIPVLTCYMYRDGEPFWLIGNGIHLGDRYEFHEMIITSGADYGSQFDPADVVRTVWGEINMRLIDCNNARFEFRPDGQGLPPFSTPMTRIVGGDCNKRASQQIDRSLTGNYFVAAADGEGIQLSREANGATWVMTWYTYLDGNQVWMIATGLRAGNRITFGDTVITRGGQWGLDFDPDQIERIPFGTITIDQETCNDITVNFASELPQFEPITREMTRIIGRDC